jgi:hypothetical protein
MNLGAFFASQKTGLSGGSVAPHGRWPYAATAWPPAVAPRPSNPLREQWWPPCGHSGPQAWSFLVKIGDKCVVPIKGIMPTPWGTRFCQNLIYLLIFFKEKHYITIADGPMPARPRFSSVPRRNQRGQRWRVQCGKWRGGPVRGQPPHCDRGSIYRASPFRILTDMV